MSSSTKRKSKVPALPVAAKLKAVRIDYHFEYFSEIELDSLGIPLQEGVPFPKLDEAQRVLFQRCCEIYRIADLFNEKREFLLQIFSEYRTRSHFEAILKTHYFETDERLAVHYDPEFYTLILGAYHFIRTLSFSLRHTESLPTTLAQELIWADANLVKTWNRVAAMAEAKYGWKFRTL